MRFRSVLIAAATGLGLSIPATVFAQVNEAFGKREFTSKCAACHGPDGKGNGPYADSLKKKPADLTTLAQRNGGVFPVSRTYTVIEGAGAGHGPREMPVWGLDYTVQANEQLPDMPYNQAQYVRTRIMALLEYLNQLQVR